MTPPTSDQTQRLHQHYVTLTGLAVPYSMGRHYYWELFITKGYTESDLSLLVAYIKRRIKDKRREKESLMFRNLIQNLENTEDDLSMARAEARSRPAQPDRDSVLRATQRTPNQETPARSAEQIMAAIKALEEFRQLKERL